MRHDKAGSVTTAEVVRAEYGTPFKEVDRPLATQRITGLPMADEGDDAALRAEEQALHGVADDWLRRW